MENMENEGFSPEAEPVVNIPQPPVENHKRSPYENAPYVMPHRPAAEPVAEPAPVKKKKSGKGKRFFGRLFTFLLGAAVALGGVYAMAGVVQEQTELRVQALESRIEVLQAELEAKENASSGESVSGTPNISPDGGMTPGQVYARNEKSVVLIDTDVSTGSGFIITEDGYVITNRHVVEDASTIHVVLYDNSGYTAQLVGSDEYNDVALLKIQGEGFLPVTIGSSDDLIVGDQVVAIGNPLGELTSTLTVGYVSAKERDVYSDSGAINMIQTDCAINSGNSGGPLFNMKGEVVGITTAKYSGTSSSGATIEGIGFAIPMDDVTDIIEDLMALGYVNNAYLGVNIYNVDPDTSRMYNIPMGCLVDSVVSGGSADRAGVRATDVITALGGYDVDGITDLMRALRKFEPGDTTIITIYRAGQTLALEITLDAKEQTSKPYPDMPSSGSYEEWFHFFFGE